MSYFSEDFAVAPGSDFATTGTYSGATLSVTYNASAEAVELSNGNDGSAWVVTSWPCASQTGLDDLLFEADLELLSDPSGRKHPGIWLVQDGALAYGYRIAHLDGSWKFSKWSGWQGESAITVTLNSNPSFDVGERHRIKVSKAGELFTVYVDDVLLFTATDFSYSNLRPGVFLYGCTVRVHALSYQGQELSPYFAVLPLGSPKWANAETQAQAFPGQNHWAPLAANPPELAAPISQVPHLTTPPTRAELGYIAGVVTVKQVPAPGRTVRCLDPTMTLVAETVSDAGGHYRFDNLLRNRRYLILAQDTWEFNYAPVGADRRTPEAYP